jgi:hypothetical protein
VLEQVGDVTYKLELPVGAKLHDVFHVGLLKSFCDDPPTSPGALPPIRHGHACLEPLAVTKSRIARGKLEVLVQWKELSTAACLVSVARRIIKSSGFFLFWGTVAHSRVSFSYYAKAWFSVGKV